MINIKHIIPPFDNYLKYDKQFHALFVCKNYEKINKTHKKINPTHFCFFGKRTTKLGNIPIISSDLKLAEWVNKYDKKGEKCVVYILKKTEMSKIKYKCVIYFDDIDSDKKWKFIPIYLPKEYVKIYRYVNIFNHPNESVKFPEYTIDKNIKKAPSIYKCFCGDLPYKIPVKFSKIMSELDIDFNNYMEGGSKPKCLSDVDIDVNGNKVKVKKKNKSNEVKQALKSYGFY